MCNHTFYKMTLQHEKMNGLGKIFFHYPNHYEDEQTPDRKELSKQLLRVIPFKEFKDKPNITSIVKVKKVPDGSTLFAYMGKKTIKNKYQPDEDKEFIDYMSEKDATRYCCVKVCIEGDISTGSIYFTKHIYIFKHYIAKN